MIDIERKAPSQQRWWREACSCRHVFPPSESSIHSFSLLSFLFTFPQLPTTHNSLGLFSHFALTHVFTFLSSSEVTSTINGGQDYRATGDPGIFYSNTCHFYCLPASLEKYVNTNNRLFSYTLVFVSSLRTFPFQHNYLHSFRNHSAFLLSPCFVHPPSSASHLYADAKTLVLPPPPLLSFAARWMWEKPTKFWTWREQWWTRCPSMRYVGCCDSSLGLCVCCLLIPHDTLTRVVSLLEMNSEVVRSLHWRWMSVQHHARCCHRVVSSVNYT